MQPQLAGGGWARPMDPNPGRGGGPPRCGRPPLGWPPYGQRQASLTGRCVWGGWLLPPLRSWHRQPAGGPPRRGVGGTTRGGQESERRWRRARRSPPDSGVGRGWESRSPSPTVHLGKGGPTAESEPARMCTAGRVFFVFFSCGGWRTQSEQSEGLSSTRKPLFFVDPPAALQERWPPGRSHWLFPVWLGLLAWV